MTNFSAENLNVGTGGSKGGGMDRLHNENQVAEVVAKYLAEQDVSSVSTGYKRTEIGVLPIDWIIEDLGNLSVISRLAGAEYTSIWEETPQGEIIALRGFNIEKNKINHNDIVRISDSLSKKLKRSRLCRGDVVYPCVGTIGNAAVIYEDNKYHIQQNIARITPNFSRLYPEFLSHYLTSPLALKEVEKFNATSSQPNVLVGSLRQYKIPLPISLEEQTAIANALSDVDALISELEKLIAKKQAIKTAAMQQLLTGRTRLPQFALREDGTKKAYKQSELGEVPEDWEMENFGRLFEPTITRRQLKSSESITFLGMQDVTESAQISNQNITLYENVKSGFTYFERGDVLVAKITPCFENGKGCHTQTLKTDQGFGSTEFHVLRAKEQADSKFIYYWTTQKIFRSDLEAEMVGSAGHRRVPLTAIANYKIPCPQDKHEQTAIATILSDMDSEIQTLEQRVNKTRQIKQGMMQELLTGKTRFRNALELSI